MSRPLTATELRDLGDSLLQSGALVEIGLVAACLVIAWAVVRQLKGTKVRAASVLFGRRVIDGVLFPVLALARSVAAHLRVLLAA